MTPQRPYRENLSRARAIQRLDAAGLLVGSSQGSDEFMLGTIREDSRTVQAGDCFVAIRGVRHDGHRHAAAVLAQGATTVFHELDIEVAVPPGAQLVRVADSRRALAELASLVEGDPGRDLVLLATTGTNGKTTTATLISHTLTTLGMPCGFIGTTGYRIPAGDLADAHHTTPGATTFYGLLAEMTRRGCTACSMEASSHAIDQSRFLISDVDVAVFTNLTRDHLDYHGSEAGYRAAKKKLFDGLRADATAVVNADDAAAIALTADCPGHVLTYGTTAAADIQWVMHGSSADGLEMSIDGHRGAFKLVGAFNAANLTATYGALLVTGQEPSAIMEALTTAAPVRGRFERVRTRTGVRVIVDYAHAPDALEQVLKTARGITPDGGSLWVVFGCGGDRDRGKRPMMGEIAERLADRVVVTSDNPRTEEPEAIMDEILSGMSQPERALRLADRAKAIRTVLDAATASDLVVIAGKGHETYQEIQHERIPFDDRAHVLDHTGD